MDVVCLGELLIDLFPAEVGRPLAEVSAFRPVPGGAPANVAVAATRLGLRAGFVGKVGDDAFGHHLQQVLVAERVDVRGLRFDAKVRTTLAFIAQPDVNSYEILFYRNPGADMLLGPEELDRSLLASTRAFHFGSITLIAEPSRSATLEALRLARVAGALTSLDVNYRPTLWPDAETAREAVLGVLPAANMVKVNEIELGLLTGTDDLAQGSATLLGLGPQLVVVTLGPEGSYFCCAQGAGHVPAFTVETVDATGCGDAFVAGLLTGLLAGEDWRALLAVDDLRRILRYANAVGALTALKQGVIPALPTREAVGRFLAARGVTS
ncbi:MAG: carbohydrate kinase [Anaerolineae bacterium]|nr:carbohydrate kinase [Anaerolineae bacterium]